MGGYGLDSSGSGQGLLAGLCGHNETLCSIKVQNFSTDTASQGLCSMQLVTDLTKVKGSIISNCMQFGIHRGIMK